ncbi:Uncharacterised protein [uncultured archaeon]|nr:Uncharacterised protein [uncultured archaeon]
MITNNMGHQINYYKILGYSLIPINIIAFILLELDFLGILPVYWNSIYVFYVFLIVNTAFLALRLNNMHEEDRDRDYTVFWSKYLFLLGLVVIAANQFLQRQLINQYMNYITAVVIALGFLTFFASKNRVEKEIEDEKENEKQAEKRRKEDFEYKFPKINRIWGLRSIVKWMYKEGWSFSIPFVIITIIFIGIKIAMPIIYNGSYIDEYNHILSGIEFFKTGHFAEIVKGEYYTRGAYLSFLVGLFFRLFGEKLFVAKLIPALLGIVNFFLLYAISKKIIIKKSYILFLMIIYSLSPWIIFNHFYIRMYVFYEFFMFFIIFLYFKINKSIRNKDFPHFLFLLIVILLVNFINFILSENTGKYPIAFLSFVLLLDIYFFRMKNFEESNQFIKYFNNISDIKLKWKIAMTAILIIILIFYFKEDLIFVFSGNLDHTTNSLKYDYFFFNLNYLYSLLFLIGFVFTLFTSRNEIKTIIFTLGIIFFIHLFSSSDLQIIRGILYFIGLFYMICIFSLIRIKPNKIRGLIMIVMIFIIFLNYPANFLNSPNIKGEIDYLDGNVYHDLNQLCHNKTIISSNEPGVLIFNGVKIDYKLHDNYASELNRLVYYDNKTNKYYDSYTKTEVITNLDQFKNITNSNAVCYLERVPVSSSWITKDTNSFIENNFERYPKEYSKQILYLKN